VNTGLIVLTLSFVGPDPIRTLPPAIIVAYSFAMDDVTSQTYGAEFDFKSHPVGLFRDQAFPIEPGEYAYEPHRGPGHSEMQRALSSGAEVICKYMLNDQRVSFRVLSCPRYGVLNLSEFQIEPSIRVELLAVLQESDDVFLLTFLDALGEHQIRARWIADGVMDWLVDHGSPSLRWFLQARYPLKVSQLVKVVRACTHKSGPNRLTFRPSPR